MSKNTILVTCPIKTRSGYGGCSRDLVRSLIAMDKYDIQIFPVRWGSTSMDALDENDPNDKILLDRIILQPLKVQPDIHIHIVIPNEFQTIGRYNIGITAGIECTVCAASWIDGINRMDLNIVPSNFAREVFTKTVYDKTDKQTKQVTGKLSVTRPIEVLFEGADTNIFKKTNDISDELKLELAAIKENFIFLYVGHWLQGDLGQDRKDTGMLVKTFLETFKNKKNKPALLLKTSGVTSSIIDRNDILEKVRAIVNSIGSEDLPNVYVLHGNLSDNEMNNLYNYSKVKAHVSFTKGEGFGRPLLEASLSGKPIIASNWSGHIDFLPKDLTVLLPGSLGNVSRNAFPKQLFVDGSQWFTVNYPFASKILFDVFSNYKKYTLNAKKLEKINKVKFSLDAMTKQFEVILDKYVPELPKEISIKLPVLTRKNDTKEKMPAIKLPKLKRV